MRPEEIGSYLATIRAAIASDLRPELRSDHCKAEAGAIVLLLERLISVLRHGDSNAAARLQTWGSLSSDLDALGFAHSRAAMPAPSANDSSERLEGLLGELQQRMGRGESFAKFNAGLASHDAKAEAWYARSVAALLDLAEAGEPAAPVAERSQQPTPVQDETTQLRSKFAAYLAKRFPALPKDAVTNFAIAPGGHVKQTCLFSLAPNNVLPPRLVLRRDLAMSITGTTVADEYPVIERAFSLGLPVPKPIFLESDASILNGRFMIMTEVENAEGAGTYFPEERRHARRTVGPDFGKEVASVLARLHTGTRGAPGGADSQSAEQIKQHYESWCAIPTPPFSLTMELSYAWLLSHPLPSNRPQCLVHGDVGSHNILVRDGHLAALLDWEIAHSGDPAEDLAQCRMMLLPDVMPWPEFAREYIAAGGDPVACDESAVAYYCVWTYIKHGLMNATLRNIYLKGERDDMIAAIVAGHYFFRLMQYQARALQIAVDASLRA
jgi:aminoglycoside phosphotransferase (APT) family kinase protein